MADQLSPLAQASAQTSAPQTSAAPDATMDAVADLQKGRLTLDQQIQKMKQTLIDRQTPRFDPTMLKLSAALLKPTKTGSAFEAFGSGAEALANEQDKDLERQFAQQKLGLELEEKGLGLKQKMAGFAQMQGLSNPQAAQSAAPMLNAPQTAAAPAGAPVAAVNQGAVPAGTAQPDTATTSGFNITPAAASSGIKPTDNPAIVQTPLGSQFEYDATDQRKGSWHSNEHLA